MIYLKTLQEIEIMTEGGHILSCILDKIEKAVKPGVTTGELEDMAIRMIKEYDGEPSFKDYKSRPEDFAFPTALCASINEEVVHAPAKPSRRLKSGDIIGIDVGMGYKGYFTDMARTIAVGKISRDAACLMKVTKKALEIGIKQVKPGNFVDDISRSIQNFVEKTVIP